MRVRYSFSSRRTGIIEGGNKHREAFPKLAQEVIRISDLVLEIIDARFIEETRNLELEDYVLAQNKKLMFVFNKADLVNRKEIEKTINEKNLKPYAIISCKTFMGKRDLRNRIKMEIKKLKIERAHVGIVGYPNTGKSSLTNMLIGRKSARVSQQSGFTKGIQKVRLTKEILLLDTPGVIASTDNPATQKEDISEATKISVKTYDKVKEPFIILSQLMRSYPNVFERYYKIKADNDPEVLVEILGKKLHFITKGSQVDINRTARQVLKDWQLGKIKKSLSEYGTFG